MFMQETAGAAVTVASGQQEAVRMRTARGFILAGGLRDFEPVAGGVRDVSSGREREIVAFAASSASNAVIAGRPQASIRTAEGHPRHIHRTLQVGPTAAPAGALA